MKYTSIFLLILLVGCISAKAKLSGTGINVHDPMHGVEVQANSINSEVEINGTR